MNYYCRGTISRLCTPAKMPGEVMTDMQVRVPLLLIITPAVLPRVSHQLMTDMQVCVPVSFCNCPFRHLPLSAAARFFLQLPVSATAPVCNCPCLQLPLSATAPVCNCPCLQLPLSAAARFFRPCSLGC